MAFTADELENRIKLVIKELKIFPTEEILSEVPYWNRLLGDIQDSFGSLEEFYQLLGDEVLTENYVDFPSEDQLETVTQILEKKKLVDRSEPGTGKSAAPMFAIYAIEQLVVKEEIRSVFVAPNYVLSAWGSKFQSYPVVPRRYLTIRSSNRSDAIAQLATGDYDTVLVSYDAIFRPIDNETRDSILDDELGINEPEIEENVGEMALVDAIINTFLNDNKTFFLAGDEIHHVNHEKAFRTKAFRKLSDMADYFVAMTGTLFPNFLDDTYELISMMDDNFDTSEEVRNAFMDDPKFIRLWLHRHGKSPVLKISDIEGMPKINDIEERWFNLSEDEINLTYHLMDYREFERNEKPVLLRLITCDASLILPENYRGSPNVIRKLGTFFDEYPELRTLVEKIEFEEPTRYQELYPLIDEIMARGEKVVIFSKYREVNQKLHEKLQERYPQYGVRRIDGSLDADPKGKMFSDRDIVRLEFQTNPDDRIVTATRDSLREGQDVHSANNVIDYQMEFWPGPNDQGRGRVIRWGQEKETHSYLFGAFGSIDFGDYSVEAFKREGINDVDNGKELPPEQRALLEKRTSTNDQPQIRPYWQNPRTLIRLMSGAMVAKGPEENTKFLEVGENGRLYALSYNFLWEYSYSAHTARLMLHLKNELVENDTNLGSIVADNGHLKIMDIASPGTISRIFRQPSTIIDINQYQIEVGINENQKLGIELETIVGNMEALDMYGIQANEYDLGVLSLALHYAKVEDRKKVIFQANKAIKKDGYLLLTLPENIIQDDGPELLARGLDLGGFDVIKERTGFVRAIDSDESDYKVFVAVARKREDVDERLYDSTEYDHMFALNPESGYVDFSQRNYGEGNGNIPADPKKEICDHFEYISSGVRVSRPIKKVPEQEVVPYSPLRSTTPLSGDANPEAAVELMKRLLGPDKK